LTIPASLARNYSFCSKDNQQTNPSRLSHLNHNIKHQEQKIASPEHFHHQFLKVIK